MQRQDDSHNDDDSSVDQPDTDGFIAFGDAVSKYNVHPQVVRNEIEKDRVEHKTLVINDKEQVFILERDASEKLAHRSFVSKRAKAAQLTGAVLVGVLVAVTSTEIGNRLNADDGITIAVSPTERDRIGGMYASSLRLIRQFEEESPASFGASFGGLRSLAEMQSPLRLSSNTHFAFFPNHFAQLAIENPLSLFSFDINANMVRRLERSVERGLLRTEVIDGQTAYVGPFVELFGIWENSTALSPDTNLTTLASGLALMASQPLRATPDVENPGQTKLQHGVIRLDSSFLENLPILEGIQFSEISVNLGPLIGANEEFSQMMEIALQNSFLQSSFSLFLYSTQPFE